MAIISAFITNLGKYNEGELAGKMHDFPTTKETLAIHSVKSGLTVSAMRSFSLWIMVAKLKESKAS